MIFKIILISLIFSNFATSSSINCYFTHRPTYECEMIIENEEGIEFYSIFGTHEIGFYDRDVTIVVAETRASKIVPKIICEKFTSLSSLIFRKIKVQILSPQSFLSCGNLKILDLSQNDLSQVADDQFKNLPNLEQLILNDNPRLQLLNGPSIFSPLTKLTKINLSGCNLNSWVSNWFIDLPNLHTIYLSNNHLTDIPSQAFHPNAPLYYLSIDNNRIGGIYRRSFARLDNLQSIFAQFNLIRDIDTTIFYGAANLINAYFLNNTCISLNINNFYGNRDYNLAQFQDCTRDIFYGPWTFITDGQTEDWRPFNISQTIGLRVRVKAASDAHVILSTLPSISSNNSEIIFGFNGNTQSIVRENLVPCTTSGSINNEANVISGDEFRTFRIYWNLDPTVLFIENNSGRYILTLRRSNAAPIGFFGVSTSGVRGEWELTLIQD